MVIGGALGLAFTDGIGHLFGTAIGDAAAGPASASLMRPAQFHRDHANPGV